MLQKKRKIAVIALLVSVCFGCLLGIVYSMIKYPQMEIDLQELYGENYENVHDFLMDEAGNLTSLSEDPWIWYQFETPMNIKNICVEITSVSNDGEWSQVLFTGPWEDTIKYLKAGRNVYTFGGEQNTKDICGIRLDLACHKDVVLQVDKVVINDRVGLMASIIMVGGQVFLALLLVMLELFLCIDLVKKHGKKIYVMFTLLNLGLQAGMIYSIYSQFIANTLSDALWTWYRIFFFVVLAVCCLALYLGELEKKRGKNVIYVMLMLMASILQFAAMEILCKVEFDFDNFFSFIFNVLIYFEIFVLLFLLIRRFAIAFSVFQVFFLVWGVVNYYFGVLRGEPLELVDLTMAGTAVNVLGNYEFQITLMLAVVLLGSISVLVMVWLSFGTEKIAISRKGLGVAGLQFGVAVVLVAVNLPEVDFWDISGVSQRSGYVYAFLGYTRAMKQSSRPQDYDATVVDKTLGELDELEEKQQQESPNVIIIMDEAFADLPAIYGFETDVDALPVIHSMQENTVKGNLLVSVYGGSTANTEYEFLTGNSMAFMPGGSVPFVEYMSSEQQSLAWKMREREYCAIGYHPYYENGYRRNIDYPLLGFEEFFSISDEMPNNEYVREYLSDSSDFENVIAMYESRDPNQPFFIFNVTMQNHGGYGAIESAVDVMVRPLHESLQKPQMEEYLSLLYETDRAFGELIDYFSQVDEETIILMFGDHQPGLGFEVPECMNGGEGSVDESMEAQQQKYISSFVMWANFDIGSEEVDLVSANYLQAILLERAGVPLSAYDQYLLKVHEQYPAINALGYCDKDGNWYENGELEDELLQKYAFMVYNNVFDKKKMTAEYY